MNRKSLFARLAVIAVVLSLAAVPSFAARGSADFTRYVALGDSYAAGVENNSLVLTHQQFSYPNIIAQQAGAPDFQQPLVSEPGIGPELQLVSIIPSVVIAPKADHNGAPINLTLPRPYNNLAIPGARARDLTALTGAEPPNTTAKAFAQFILRGQGTAVQQALAMHPTFISVEIGGNDVLGAVLAGTPRALTPLVNFYSDYKEIIDELTAGAPDAGIVVTDVPNLTSLPFATTIPPVLVNPATNQPVLDPQGHPIFYVAHLGDNSVGQLTPGSLVLLTALPYLQQGYGFPGFLKPLFPTLPHVGEPLPDEVVLDTAELAIINQRAHDVSGSIAEIAAAKDIPVVHTDGVMHAWTQGIDVGGIDFSNAFITGGLMSLDGFHPTDIGYTLIANEFIKTINDAYKTEIPYASILQFFSNNDTEAGDMSSFLAMFYTPDMPLDFAASSFDGVMHVDPADFPADVPQQ